MGDAEKIIRAKLSNFPDHGARDGAAVYKITGAELGAILDELTRTQAPSTSGADEREEIARLIDPPFWADLDDTLQWLESQGGKYEAGWPRFRFLKRELAHVMELYDRADAILARAQGPGEAVALTSALANACYLMSEPHLSGHRVILGFDTLDGATAAHVALSMAIIAATPTREGDDLTPEGRAAPEKATA